MIRTVTKRHESTIAGLPMQPDVTVENHGTIFLFFLWSSKARAWVAEYVPDPLWFGQALAVEHGFARALAEGMQESGLEVR